MNLWMSLTLVRKESKLQRNLDLNPTSKIITDIIKKNSGCHVLKSDLTEGGNDRSSGELT